MWAPRRRRVDGRAERERRATQLAQGLARRIGAMSADGTLPPHLGRWHRAWEIVGPASEDYMEGERRFVAGELDEDAMGRLGRAVLNAWRDAGQAAQEKIRQHEGG